MSISLSTLTSLTLAQPYDGDGDGDGVCIFAATDFPASHRSTGYVLHVEENRVKLATKDPFTGKSNSCSPGKEYAVGDVPRIPPWHVIENGNRLLLPLGDRKADSRVVPLVLRAGAK